MTVPPRFWDRIQLVGGENEDPIDRSVFMGGKKNKKAKKAALRASVPQVQFRNGTSGPNQDPSGCQKTSGEPKCTPRIQRQESFLRRMLSLNFLGRRPKAETSEASSYKTASARSPLTSTTDSFSDTITVPADTSDSISSNLSKSAKRKQRLLKTVQIKAELNATNSPIKDRSNCTISFLCPSRNLDDLKDLVDTVVNMDSEEEGRISAMRQINDTLKTTEDYLKRICLRMFLSDWGISSVLSESGVDTGDSDLTSEFRIYRDSEKADDLAGDKNTSRSAIELLRNVVDKHKTHTNIVMDALELLLVLDSDRLTCLPALLRDLQNGRKELPSPAPSDPEHNSPDPLHLDTSTPQLKFDRNANALKSEPSSDIDNSNTGLHSYSIVLKAPTTPAPIRGAPPPPPPPGHLPSVRAPPPPPPPLGITTPKASYVTAPSTPVCRSPPPPPPPIELTSPSAAPLCRVAPTPPPPPPPGPTSPGFAAPVLSIPSTPVSSRRAPPPPSPPPSGLHGSPLPLISISGPPPPPPPPGVAMSPGLTPKPVKSEEFYPKNKKTCPIRWVKISHHNIQDVSTVWSDYSRPDFSTSERMDLETMFEVTEVKTPRLGSIKKKIEPDYLQEAHLDANRTLALEVLLAKFKGPSMEVVAKLESCVVGVYSTDLLTSLLQAFPTNEEVEPFLAMEMPPNGKANRLCWEVARKPQLKSRVELMVARETLPPEVTQRLDDCKNLASAFETLRGEVVLRVLHKCLQCGNFVNQGSPMAHAAGFRLSSLPDLLATKAKNSSANFRRFVDFLVRNMDIGDSEVDEVIDSLVAFTKLSTDDLWAEHERLSRSLAKLKASVQSKGDEGLLQIYRDSLESSEKDMDCLASEVATLRQTEKEVLAYFCADKTDTMAVIASTLTTAFKSIGEALKSMKSPLTRSQSMMSLTRSTSLLDNTLGSLRREDSFRLSLRKKTPVVCPSREQLSSIFLNTPNRH